jgi:hypothetical protein
MNSPVSFLKTTKVRKPPIPFIRGCLPSASMGTAGIQSPVLEISWSRVFVVWTHGAVVDPQQRHGNVYNRPRQGLTNLVVRNAVSKNNRQDGSASPVALPCGGQITTMISPDGKTNLTMGMMNYPSMREHQVLVMKTAYTMKTLRW